MFCRRCGTENDDNAYKCVNCGEQLQGFEEVQRHVQEIPDYLVWSILSTILCCQIPGIVSIVYSVQVNKRIMIGDYAGAQQASNSAKNWAIAAAVIWGVGVLGYLAFVLVMVAAGGMN